MSEQQKDPFIIQETTVSILNQETDKYQAYPWKAKVILVIFDDLDPESGDKVVGELEYPIIHEGFARQIVRDSLCQIIQRVKLLAHLPAGVDEQYGKGGPCGDDHA